MNIFERVIAVIAPVNCLGCGTESDGGICGGCRYSALMSAVSVCYRCNALTDDFRVCRSCRSSSRLRSVFVAYDFSALVKQLIYSYKYDSLRSTSIFFSNALYERMPESRQYDMVCPIPSASKRIRQRGFDHTALLAQHYVKLSGGTYRQLLRRLGQTKQVGANRQQRIENAARSYALRSSKQLAGKRILLIDDVVTTGASLNACAALLREAGARQVDALVVAREQ